MRVPEGSKRTKVLFWLYSAVLVLAVALMFWLFATLAGDLLDKPLPTFPLVAWLTIAVIPLVALRIALAWSMRSDRQAS